MRKPVVIASHLCEQTITDVHTGRLTLVNCFNSLRFHKLPAVIPAFVFFATFTDGPKKARMNIRLRDPFDTLLWQGEMTVTFSDPSELGLYTQPFYNTVLKAFGMYAFEVDFGGELVLVRRFGVYQLV